MLVDGTFHSLKVFLKKLWLAFMGCNSLELQVEYEIDGLGITSRIWDRWAWNYE